MCCLRLVLVLFLLGPINLASGSDLIKLPSFQQLDLEVSKSFGARHCMLLTPEDVDGRVKIGLALLHGHTNIFPDYACLTLSMIPRECATARSEITHALINLIFSPQDLPDSLIYARMLALRKVQDLQLGTLQNMCWAILKHRGFEGFSSHTANYTDFRSQLPTFLQVKGDAIFYSNQVISVPQVYQRMQASQKTTTPLTTTAGMLVPHDFEYSTDPEQQKKLKQRPRPYVRKKY
jgi:hypothetical protein